MSLDHGGHLTHGSPVNISGRFYNFVAYRVTPSDERIDYDQIRDLALEHRPKMIVAGATAYPRDHRSRSDPRRSPTRWARCSCSTPPTSPGSSPVARTRTRSRTPTSSRSRPTRRSAARVAAASSSRAEHDAAIDKAIFPGLQGGPLEHVIAGKAVAFREAAHPSFARLRAPDRRQRPGARRGARRGEGFRLVSGGTDNHLMLVDLRPFDAELTGKDAQIVLDEAGITLNKNTVPDDPRSPFVTSGLRIGTPSVTTQGMAEPEMAEIAGLIARVLRDRERCRRSWPPSGREVAAPCAPSSCRIRA